MIMKTLMSHKTILSQVPFIFQLNAELSINCLLHFGFDHNCFLFLIARKLETKSDLCSNHGEPCGYTRGVAIPKYVGACCGELRCDQNPKGPNGWPLLGGAGKCAKGSFLNHASSFF